jgi:hypothetical protein
MIAQMIHFQTRGGTERDNNDDTHEFTGASID